MGLNTDIDKDSKCDDLNNTFSDVYITLKSLLFTVAANLIFS